MVELGKLILHHYPYFSVTILITSMPSNAESMSAFISRISLTNLPISFYPLPTLNLPHHHQYSPKTPSPVAMALEFIRLNVPNVLSALQNISLTSTIQALITSSFHFSYDTNIPIYFYFTSGASSLSSILYLPTIYSQTTKSLRDLNTTLLSIPGLPPIKASHLPEPLLDRDDPACHAFLNLAPCVPRLNGIILNTFESLEARAIKAIADGICIPTNITPPVYCIGPLVADAKDRIVLLKTAAMDCLSWLDAQPSRSVVFLCFGSKGIFSVAQLKEIAMGLERSDQRFLWVVRNPQPGGEEPNLDSLLPEGFLERTKENGLVVKSWAPQAAVLTHKSVGGFVTHCGWNSVVEAVSSGVPMVAWPLYAEQHLNSVVLVEEMKLALPIDLSSSHQLVSAEEVESRLRELMKSEDGEALRKRSLEMKVMALAAWKFGGSSLVDFSNLVGSWKRI